MNRLGLIWRLASADLRDGLKGFRVFVLSLALGALVISAAGSAAQSFRDGLLARSREILGGDLLVSVPQRPLSAQALAFWEAQGRTALTIETRAMAQTGVFRRLVEVRGYGPGFPLQGQVQLQDGGAFRERLSQGRDGIWNALVEPALLSTFHLEIGDSLILGRGQVRIAGVIKKEPDALGRGFALAPRVILPAEALGDLGLAGFGSLYTSRYHLALPPNADVGAVREAAEKSSIEFRGRMRDRRDAAPGLSETIDRLESFLDFVGLAALLAGGIGVAGSIRGWLAGKRPSIATLKTLGASSLEIEAVLLVQVGLLALISTGLGAFLGSLAPMLIAAIGGADLPIQPQQQVYWGAFGTGLGLAWLAAIAFSMAPIGAGRAVPPSALYRGQEAGRPPWPERVIGAGLMLVLAGLAAAQSANPGFTAMLAAAAIGAFALLAGLGKLVQWLAKHGARRARGLMRLALSGLGGPNSLAPAAAPALGLGLALLCALAQAQANLVEQVERTAPQRAPSVVYTEIPAAEAARFDETVFRAVGEPLELARYARAPILTARFLTRNGAPIDIDHVKEGERWLVDGDIGVSSVPRRPEDQAIEEGKFWDGPTPSAEVSIEAEAAKGAGFRIGDELGFEVAGVPISARLTSLRKVDFGGFGPTFAVLFSPGAIDGAITRHVAIARLEPDEEERVVKAIAGPYPNVGVLRIRDALAAAAELFRSLRLAIQAVAAIAIVAGALAVAGAVAAGARRRIYEGAVLRALGATRLQALLAVAIELALTGAAAAGIGALLGFAAAYALIVRVFEAEWHLHWPVAMEVIGGAVAALGLGGALAGWIALSDPPARTLKAERAQA